MSTRDDHEHAPAQRLAQREAGERRSRAASRVPRRPPPGTRPRASSVRTAPRRPPRPPRRGRARSAARPRAWRRRTCACPPPVSTSTPPAWLSSAGVPAATTSPRSMIATRSQTSSTSDSRCEFSSTLTPRARRRSSSAADGAPAGGVERARRLVEQQQPRRRRPSPARARAAAACPSTSCRRGGRGPRARPTSSSSRVALGRAAVRAGELAGAARAARRRCTSPGSGTARRGSRAPPCASREPAGAPQTSRVAGGRPHEPAGDLDERRLAGAVGPEQAEQLALADLEVDAAAAPRWSRSALRRPRDREGGGPSARRIAAMDLLAPPPLRWDGARLHVLDQTRLPARGGRARRSPAPRTPPRRSSGWPCAARR